MEVKKDIYQVDGERATLLFVYNVNVDLQHNWHFLEELLRGDSVYWAFIESLSGKLEFSTH